MSQSTPWAVLLCKFSNDQRGFVAVNKPEIEAMFTDLNEESVPAYWRDVSYGALDLSGSRVFGWLTLRQKQSDYLASGSQSEGRAALVTWARKAAADAGIDLTPFYGVTLYMSTQTDLWGGLRTVVCDVESNMSQILQEYGHGYGLKHSRSVANPADYQDPFCIMSGLDFGGTDPTFPGRFGSSGPLLCGPYVEAAGWLTEPQVARIETDGTRPQFTTLSLSPLGGTGRPYPQMSVFGLQVPYEVTYFVEYRSGGWDRGLSQRQVVIHQRRADGYAYFAGSIATSVGFENGFTLLPGRSWMDPAFDLSVRLVAVRESEDEVEITVGPAAAVQNLSVRNITASKLGLTGGMSLRSQILLPPGGSLRARLLELINT